ncbi:MAG: CPBP family intramembrane metalloprotease [Nocardioides sp.]|uniref:CPBP family intramembrane glutamic endopeptidase n=1 Tax=Nocardioides sp. TaxID=35761 RepID=UPI0039E3ADFD
MAIGATTAAGDARVHTDVEYQELHHVGKVALWRTSVGTGALLVLFVGLPILVAIPFTLGLIAGGADSDRITDFFSLDPVTPGNLAYTDIGLAAAIGAAILVTWLMHGRLSPRWLLSVVGRLRWRWLLVCLGLSLVTLILTLAVSLLLPDDGGDADLGGSLNAFTSQTLGFVAVVVLLTPLQAAGEEFVFRGYLTQAWGGWAATRSRALGRLVGVLLPALLFGLAHGLGQEVPVFLDRFAFGIVAGVLVILTGGLEAGIAMHVLNNVVAYALALAFGDITSALTDATGSWWLIVTTLTQSLVYLGLVALVGPRFGVVRRAPVRFPPGLPMTSSGR